MCRYVFCWWPQEQPHECGGGDAQHIRERPYVLHVRFARARAPIARYPGETVSHRSGSSTGVAPNADKRYLVRYVYKIDCLLRSIWYLFSRIPLLMQVHFSCMVYFCLAEARCLKSLKDGLWRQA